MVKLIKIEDSIANKISFYHFALLLLSLPFDRFYSHLIFISLLIHTLIHLRKSTIKPVFTVQNLILSAIFFVTVLGTAYSPNRALALTEIGQHSIILLMPILFCLNPFDFNKYRQQLFLIFSLGCTAAVIYLYAQVLITIRYYHLPIADLFSSAFTNHNFSEPFAIHATYFSMQLCLALLYLLTALIKKEQKKYKVLLVLSCLVLMAGLIQLGSKSILFALLILLNFGIPFFLLKDGTRFRFSLISLTAILLLFVGIYKIDALRNRYVTTLKKDLTLSSDNNLNDPRLARWQIAVNVAREAPLIGHGTATEVDLLRPHYFEKKFYRAYLAALNAHNEYLSLWIKTGIWGVSIFLINLFFGFKISIQRKDLVFFTFMVLISIISFSENILDVDKGIFFYSLFFSMFYFAGYEPEKTKYYSYKSRFRQPKS